MYVAAESGEARFVHRHMAEDHAVHDMVRTDLAEVLGVVLELENVVIAFYQDLVTVEPLKDAEALPVDHDVAQVIHFVRGAHTLVPALHHGLVHLLCRSKRTER